MTQRYCQIKINRTIKQPSIKSKAVWNFTKSTESIYK